MKIWAALNKQTKKKSEQQIPGINIEINIYIYIYNHTRGEMSAF